MDILIARNKLLHETERIRDLVGKQEWRKVIKADKYNILLRRIPADGFTKND